jgi:hypothetical protein
MNDSIDFNEAQIEYYVRLILWENGNKRPFKRGVLTSFSIKHNIVKSTLKGWLLKEEYKNLVVAERPVPPANVEDRPRRSKVFTDEEKIEILEKFWSMKRNYHGLTYGEFVVFCSLGMEIESEVTIRKLVNDHKEPYIRRILLKELESISINYKINNTDIMEGANWSLIYPRHE